MEKKVYVVRISTTLNWAEFNIALMSAAGKGDVERVGPYVEPPHYGTSNGSTPATPAALPVALPPRKKRQYSAEGLSKLRESNKRWQAENREKCLVALEGVLRANAHAPSFKLVNLMDQTGVLPRNAKKWNERLLKVYVDDALARITAPGTPPVKG